MSGQCDGAEPHSNHIPRVVCAAAAQNRMPPAAQTAAKLTFALDTRQEEARPSQIQELCPTESSRFLTAYIVDCEEWAWSRVLCILYKVPFLTWVILGSFENKQYCGITF